MFQFDKTIKKYHIPKLDVISQDSLSFSFWDISKLEIAVSSELAHNLSLILNSSDLENLSSKNLFHILKWGNWIDDEGNINKLYHAPYNTNTVIRGDLVVVLNNENIDVSLYLGKWKYLVFDNKSKNLFAVNTSQLAAIFPNHSKCILKNIDTPYESEFIDFYNTMLMSWKLQLHTNKKDPEMLSDYQFLWTQRLYDSYVKELYSLYDNFEEEEAKEIIYKLNERKIVQHLKDSYYLHQNRNSRSFYRDANYSFSVVDHNSENWAEVAIISFFPDGKDIEIVQIGGNTFYETDFLLLWTTIIDFMKQYFTELWFSNLKILRGDKNINYIHPKQNTLKKDFDIDKHQETMLLRYNVTPHRKWGFTKPDEWYSYFTTK
jgi:hypothetical protein